MGEVFHEVEDRQDESIKDRVLTELIYNKFSTVKQKLNASVLNCKLKIIGLDFNKQVEKTILLLYYVSLISGFILKVPLLIFIQ